jgi:WD40 repeat protein
VCAESGHIVYHIAAIGVVLDAASGQQQHYMKHTDDILCLAMHPSKDICATGQAGKQAVVNVWTADKDMNTLATLANHETGVCALDFSRFVRLLLG